jgi:hypothetical protein
MKTNIQQSKQHPFQGKLTIRQLKKLERWAWFLFFGIGVTYIVLTIAISKGS